MEASLIWGLDQCWVQVCSPDLWWGRFRPSSTFFIAYCNLQPLLLLPFLPFSFISPCDKFSSEPLQIWTYSSIAQDRNNSEGGWGILDRNDVEWRLWVPILWLEGWCPALRIDARSFCCWPDSSPSPAVLYLWTSGKFILLVVFWIYKVLSLSLPPSFHA